MPDDWLWRIVLGVPGGLIIAFLLFVWRDRVFPPTEVRGEWWAKLTTHESSHGDFVEMVRFVHLVLDGDGKTVRGSGEIVREESKARHETLVGKRRFLLDVTSGSVEHRYTSPDILRLVIATQGPLRTSTMHLEADLRYLTGKFSDTAGDQRGRAELSRQKYAEAQLKTKS